MTSLNLTTAKANAAPAISGAPIISFFERLREAAERRRRIRETIRQLEPMSDRELADIGVTRGDIRRVAEETA